MMESAISHARYPFTFQASEHPFHWGVLAVSWFNEPSSSRSRCAIPAFKGERVYRLFSVVFQVATTFFVVARRRFVTER
ncbi:MAG: hypothetical protein N6V49_00675 [Serratia symbiotica]|nr:hypothetical protein [Serratia symbiotica]